MLTIEEETALRRQNKATMSRCRGCIHLTTTEAGDYWICDYLQHTGRMRPCSIENCTEKELPEPGKKRRNAFNVRTLLLFIVTAILCALTLYYFPETLADAGNINAPTFVRDADAECIAARERTLAKREQRYAEPTGEWVYIGQYRITGYDICVACCGKTDGITASGVKATVGRTVAAPSSFAFGTRLLIDGIGERIVEDRGGAIKGNKIDVLCSDHAECYALTGWYDVYKWVEW